VTSLSLASSDAAPAPSRRLSALFLLVLAGLFLVLSAVQVSLVTGSLRVWTGIVVWTACAAAGWLIARRSLPGIDPLIYATCMTMAGWGLLMVYRLLPNFGDRQAVWLAMGTAGMLAALRFPDLLGRMRRYRYSILLLLATILFGTNPSGFASAPALWLGTGSIFFQPSELLKIVLVVFLASYLAEQYPVLRSAALFERSRRVFLAPRIAGPVVLMWGLCVVILVWQRDLGTAILFFMLFVTLLYVASGSNWVLVTAGILIVIAAVAAYFLFDVVQLRVDIWLNPWIDPDNRAYQIVQSLMTFSAGGTFGQGIGLGFPSYVPVIHSDFMFAAIAEESGFLGVVTVIALLMVLVSRSFQAAALQHGKPFPTLLAIGFSTLIAVQSLMIMGGVLKVIPLTGVTLPFFSYGGSSLVVSFFMVGILLRLSAAKG
jgi:cell division protein FtsW (lipid II flippase)